MHADALLAEILANPDEDAPRLIYADWLEEHGDADQATFIRLQVRRAQIDDSLQLVPGYVECHALDRQADELLSRHKESWTSTLPRSLRRGQAEFRRGFVEALELPVNQLFKVSARTWARHPIRELAPEEVSGKLGQLLAMPQLACIRKLRLPSGLSEEDLAALAATDNLSQLRNLKVSGSEGNPVVEALARCPSLRGLTRVFLDHSHLDAEPLARFTASANVTNLTDLRLDALRRGAAGRTRVLARSPGLAGLTRLFLNWSDEEGIAALSDSPHLAGLRWLKLPCNDLSPEGVAALAATRHLTRLQILELEYNPFGVAGVRALAGGTWKELARLDLGSCELGDEGAVALAECRSLRGLRSLSVDSNKITAGGVRALVRSPHLRNLVWLSLYANKIGDEGALALCESQTLGKLGQVELGYCGPFSPAVQEALRRRFGAGLLRQ
jgi:uncharacterized protein (TIGR02996 family)